MKPYPLQWPAGRKRTADPSTPRTRYSIARTIPPLLDELDKLGARQVVITSHAKLKPNGLPYSDSDQPKRIPDSGVAVWFRLSVGAADYCLSCDKTDTIGGNLREIGLATAELRSLYGRLGIPLPMLLCGLAAQTDLPQLPRPSSNPSAPVKTTTQQGLATKVVKTVPKWQKVLGVENVKNLTWNDCLSAYQMKFRKAQTQVERDELVAAQTAAAWDFGKDIS